MTATWLELFPAAATPLCINDDLSTISRAQFWRDVASEYPAIAALSSTTVALHNNDSYDFLVLLMAALAAGKILRLPPSRLAAQEREFARSGIVFLSRQPQADAEYLPAIDPNWPERAQLAFYTSGSTSEPKCIERTLAQLLTEVATLAASLPLAPTTTVLATVSHQHIYGLLFKALWPLMAGHSFYRRQLAFPEAVIAAQQKLAAPNVLVASPALLKRWSQDLALHNCQWVSSSGGMLAAGLRANINAPLLEIYGSSETGGIASRWQDHAPWQALPGVSVRCESSHTLLIQSPHACSRDWLDTGDRARSTGVTGQFELLGRQDRLIKLEEKRISLDTVEQALCQQDSIEQAHITVLDHGNRQFLGAVIAPTTAIYRQLQQGALSKQTWLLSVRQHLAERVESVALPRHFRLLSALPYNAQGKLDKHYLRQLFDRMTFPVIIQQQRSETSASLRLDFPPELECFKGHFPNEPIYPGLAQIGFVEHFARRIWPELGWVDGLEQMKFQALIKPFSQLELLLHLQGAHLQFTLRDGDTTVASGRLTWQLHRDCHV